MNVDITQLTNTVQTTNTLLKQVWVERQIKHHKLVSELEVTTFRADFTTDKNLSAALLLSKVSRSFITL